MVTWPMMSRDVTLEGQTCDPNPLKVQYLENSWRCYLATIANYYSLLWGSTVGFPSDSLALFSLAVASQKVARG